MEDPGSIAWTGKVSCFEYGKSCYTDICSERNLFDVGLADAGVLLSEDPSKS